MRQHAAASPRMYNKLLMQQLGSEIAVAMHSASDCTASTYQKRV